MSCSQYLTNNELRGAIASGDSGRVWSACALLATRLSKTYRHDVEDLIQTATLKAVQVVNAGKVRLDVNPFSYLTRVIMNAMNAHIAREKKHRHLGYSAGKRDEDR